MDSTLLKANASIDSLVSRDLYRQACEKTKDYLDQVWAQDTESEHDQIVDKPVGPRRGDKKISANEMRVSKTDPSSSSTVSRSTPGAPPSFCTRLSAAVMLSLLSTLSNRSPPSCFAGRWLGPRR